MKDSSDKRAVDHMIQSASFATGLPIQKGWVVNEKGMEVRLSNEEIEAGGRQRLEDALRSLAEMNIVALEYMLTRYFEGVDVHFTLWVHEPASSRQRDLAEDSPCP